MATLTQRVMELVGFNDPQPTTQAFCPECEDNLINQTGNVIANNTSTGIVVLWCEDCGTTSTWDFGAPSPVLIEAHRPKE